MVSGGLSFATFRSMGYRLTDEFVKLVTGEDQGEMELNPEFLASIVDVDDSNHRRR